LATATTKYLDRAAIKRRVILKITLLLVFGLFSIGNDLKKSRISRKLDIK
jgi:hypothetical protein